MMLTRQTMHARSRVLSGFIGALCATAMGVMLLGAPPATAQVPPDFGRFTPVSGPVPIVPGGSGGAAGSPAPGLYVQVLDGMINVSNPGGATLFNAGQFGFTPSMTAPPIVLPQNPGLRFTPPPVFQAATPPSTPPPVVIPPPLILVGGPGFTLMNWGSDGLGSLGAGIATFSVQNGLTNFTESAMPFAVNTPVTVADAGAVSDLGWGRWTSGTVTDHGVPFDLSTWKSGMPYLVGKPTLDANLPIFGTMTYSLAGATKAIDMVTGAVGTLSGSLSIAFQNAQYNVTPNLSIAMPGQTYVTGAGMTIVGPDGARATFSTMTQNVTGGACAVGACTLSTKGILTGAAANNAGIVYSLTGPDIQVTGAAGFKR